ncbi:UvrD-helicase domain-containing protein [Piscinibacter sp. XHJ-5]|uniref:UvrD-helicase domain-containing protein n=1 Tax=Piscinibacter sp. XHJ-5 TaxID=3037797 RepID=UPI00245348D8|nr:UvrD-helicase domain-containing protein [Piscinibacter sp. XHJ-5]
MNAAAYAIDHAAVSREAFYAAACDPARSVIVEACAGAGKTWMLVSRILRALLEGAQPQEILAITFTKKAAGEMRERLDEWLAGFAAGGEAQRLRELQARGLTPAQAAQLAPQLAALHERVLRGGRMVEVRTFHAWFWQLLRVAPLELLAELGLQPEMELVEDPTEHQADVYRRFHAAVAADVQLREDFNTLVRERGRTQLRRWLDAAWGRRVDVELADAAGTLEDSVPAPDAGGHPARRLRTMPWREQLSALAATLARGGVRAQEAAQRLAVALDEADPAASFEAAWLALFTADKGTPRTQIGKPSGLVEAQAALERLCAQVRQHEAHVEHRRMVRLSRVLLAEYAAFKRARGLADMSDLERGALALLRDSTQAGWVQERLDARVRHLLIDEFQDTSPLQWHALHAWLSGYAGAGGGASGQRPPGVFIVGDPKQSIYRFRGAEPRVFEAARHFVVQALGGSVLACDHTRRNAPEVLEVLNGVFDAAQNDGEFGGFRPHTTEVPAGRAEAGVYALRRIARPPAPPKSDADEVLAPWRDSLTQPRHEPEEVLREQEARAVAAAVRELIEQGAAPAGGIHVLCRKRESLRLVADALAAVHVPYAAAEDFELLDAPQARDLIAVLDVLVSPQHRLSLAHALRSPVFGASDDDLIALARASTPHGDWWRALRDLPQPSHALRRARDLLARWRTAARQLPPHDLLDIVVAEGEVRERLVATVPPERRAGALAAVDALLHRALTLDGARYATPYNFVRALKRRTISVPAALQPGAVQLLTVHGAKGLEAEVVFVMDADPEERPADTATLLVDWPVESEHPRRCAFVYSEKRCPPALTEVLERERIAREREEMNGLYVAMTRARTRLVFSATEPRPGDRVSWWSRVQPWTREWAPMRMTGDASPAGPASALLALPRVSPRPPVAPRPPADSDAASRLGQAVHRVLEWIAGDKARDLAPLAGAAAREFAVDEREVARLARLIWRSPASARFFRGDALRWAGNEVPVADGGEALRIDRLVQLEEAGRRAWWVLDYKLQHAPQALAEYRDQLRRYRGAVQRLQPGETVRCAFITGQGEVVEVD